MSEPDLISRAIEQSLELAAAATGSSDEWNDARASAYARGCDLAQAALQAAVQTGGSSPPLEALGQLASIAEGLAGRLVALEQRQEASAHA